MTLQVATWLRDTADVNVTYIQNDKMATDATNHRV